jgi:hypothetical protein
VAEDRKSSKWSSAERRENENVYSVTVRAMGQVHRLRMGQVHRLRRKEKIGRYEKDG